MGRVVTKLNGPDTSTKARTQTTIANLLGALKDAYGGEVAARAMERLEAKWNDGKPLTARLVQNVLDEAQQLSDQIAQSDRDRQSNLARALNLSRSSAVGTDSRLGPELQNLAEKAFLDIAGKLTHSMSDDELQAMWKGIVGNLSAPDKELVTPSGVESLPESLTGDPDFQSALATLRNNVLAGLDIGQDCQVIGDLIADRFEGEDAMPSSHQLHIGLSDPRAFAMALIGKKAFESLPEDQQALLVAMHDRIAASTADRDLGDGRIRFGGGEYVVGKELGKGNFGITHVYVYDGPQPRPESLPEKLVVKTPRIRGEDFDGDPMEVLRDGPLKEARALANMTGTGGGDLAERFARLEGVMRNRETGSVMIAMRFEEGGTASSLVDKLKQRLDDGVIDNDQYFQCCLTLLKDVIEGARRLQEAKKIVHFDLKADNWLVGGDGKAKIADPGIATSLHDEARALGSEELPGYIANPEGSKPISWTAPEVIGRENTTSSADVWTLGIVMYEFLGLKKGMMAWSKGEHPINQNPVDFMDLALSIRDRPDDVPLRAPNEDSTPLMRDVLDLMNAMTTQDPANRPTFAQVLAHPALNEPGIGSEDTRELIRNAISGGK